MFMFDMDLGGTVFPILQWKKLGNLVKELEILSTIFQFFPKRKFQIRDPLV